MRPLDGHGTGANRVIPTVVSAEGFSSGAKGNWRLNPASELHNDSPPSDANRCSVSKQSLSLYVSQWRSMSSPR